eukprot:TRINITY_DN1061_c1_g3_i2.p1 TRINITY_DN1061_c1_g3~~TRINITY_DN1061_c1_g3_i2.p1  ORF type:complete len:258 (+),score=19.22 TRINITY_DN1061_c1_g3_i2:67-840(+)
MAARPRLASQLLLLTTVGQVRLLTSSPVVHPTPPGAEDGLTVADEHVGDTSRASILKTRHRKLRGATVGSAGDGQTCCSNCGTHAFCSPSSGECYDFRAKSHYRFCNPILTNSTSQGSIRPRRHPEFCLDAGTSEKSPSRPRPLSMRRCEAGRAAQQFMYTGSMAEAGLRLVGSDLCADFDYNAEGVLALYQCNATWGRWHFHPRGGPWTAWPKGGPFAVVVLDVVEDVSGSKQVQIRVEQHGSRTGEDPSFDFFMA